jgi:hypothetical protein
MFSLVSDLVPEGTSSKCPNIGLTVSGNYYEWIMYGERNPNKNKERLIACTHCFNYGNTVSLFSRISSKQVSGQNFIVHENTEKHKDCAIKAGAQSKYTRDLKLKRMRPITEVR